MSKIEHLRSIKMRFISVSADVWDLKKNRLFSKEVARKYPGAGWAFYFERLVKDMGYEAVTSDVALDLVKSKAVHPVEFGVIQHLDEKDSLILINMGAIPLINFCLESPLFVPKFYWNLPKIAGKFPKHVYFSGMFDSLGSKGIFDDSVYFPSFSRDDVHCLPVWRERRFMCCVTSKKLILHFELIKFLKYWDLIGFLRIVYSELRRIVPLGFVLRRFGVTELQMIRLSTVSTLYHRGMLELSGRGWDNATVVPRSISEANSNIPLKEREIKNQSKIDYIKEFKYVLCFENCEYRGYVTEKMVDAIVAGCIPVYWGASDIASYVPLECFIDGSEFDDAKKLLNYLADLPFDVIRELRASGQRFLQSSLGNKYSYEVFACMMANDIAKVSEIAVGYGE